MFFEFYLTIPANTAKANEITKECSIGYGVINKVDVQFPSGCAGFAHLAIDRFKHQILPTNIDGYFTSDNTTITTNEDIEVYDKPFTVYIRGYNTDDTFDHTIYVRVYVSLKKVVEQVISAESLSTSLMSQFSEMGVQ